MENNGNVNLTISKEIVNPIVQAKINEAVIEALGGKDELVAKVVGQIINQKVDHQGKVSVYLSDNKHTWLEIVATQQIKTAVESALREQMQVSGAVVKAELIRQLQTKKGASKIAEALLSAFDGNLANSYRNSIEIKFEKVSH